MLLAGLPAGVEDTLRERLPGVVFRAVDRLEAAREELGRQRPDAAVIDHELPGGGGTALVRELRASSGGGSVPILYCASSSLPVEEARQLVGSLKVTRLLFHPLDRGAVAEQLGDALRPAGPIRAAADRPANLASAVANAWEKFRGLTLERVATLEEAAVALLSGSLDPDLRQRAERDAHKLAGSVGTFGFAEGSKLARSVELLLDGTRPLEPADALSLSEWVDRLREELERRPRPPAAP